ncbi:MAG: hypothetical protein ACOWWH_02690 [Eubacteriaceae bacterium]
MKIKSPILGIIIFIIIFGGIAGADMLGIWKTKSSKLPIKFDSGEYIGEYNPADIRGSYSFDDIYNAFQISPQVLATAFELDIENPEEFLCKDLEQIYSSMNESNIEIGTSSIRYFVALYKGLPFEFEKEMYLPQKAVEILIKNKTLEKQQEIYLQDHVIDSTQLLKAKEAPAEEEKHEEEKEFKVNGNTTFKELISWGVSQQEIEDIIVEEISDDTITVKEFCNNKGIKYSNVKIQLQYLVDEKNK